MWFMEVEEIIRSLMYADFSQSCYAVKLRMVIFKDICSIVAVTSFYFKKSENYFGNGYLNSGFAFKSVLKCPFFSLFHL